MIDYNDVQAEWKIDALREVYSPQQFAKLGNNDKLILLKKLYADPVIFSKALLNYDPFEYQIPLLRSTDKRSIIVKGRQTGGSKTLSAKVVYSAFTNQDGVYAIVAPSQRQSSLLFKSVMDWFQQHEWLQAELNIKGARFTQTEIQLPNRSIIYALPSGRDGRTIRGLAIGSNGYIVYDEAAMIPDRAFEAMDFSTATGGGVILNSTPLGEDGYFYEQYCLSTLATMDKPIYKGYHWPSEINPLISKEFIEIQKRSKSELAFQQEVLGQFVAGFGKWFDRKAIQNCIDHECPQLVTGDRSKHYVIGIDLGIENDPCVVTICEVLDEKHLRVVRIDAFLNKQSDDNYQLVNSYDDIVEYVADLYHKRGFTATQVNVDATNQSYVSTMLQKKGLPVVPIKWGSTTGSGSSMKLSLMSTLQTAFKNKQIIIPNEPILLRQLYKYSYSITENKNYKFTAKDEDFIDSLAMAVYSILGEGMGTGNFYSGSRQRKKGGW